MARLWYSPRGNGGGQNSAACDGRAKENPLRGVLIGGRAIPELAKGVVSPGVQLAIGADGQAVEGPGGNGSGHHSGRQSDGFGAVVIGGGTVPELTVAVVARGVEPAVRADGQHVVLPADMAVGVTLGARVMTSGVD